MKRLWSVDNRVKATLFVLAVLLWFFVIGSQDYEASLSIPLVIKGLEPEYTLVEDPPGAVEIACKGRGRDLLVWRYLMKARLELNISGLGKRQDFPLIPQMITVPAGFPVRDLRVASPETLRLFIDRIAEVRLPIRADCEIVPAAGFAQVGPIICDPESLTIRGPQILVQQVDELATRYRRFTDADQSIEWRAPLRNIFSSKILLEAQHVLVRARVEAIAEVSLDSVRIEVRNIPRGYRSTLSPERVDVVLEGPVSSLHALDTVAIQLVLDYQTDWTEDDVYYIPAVESPVFLRLKTMEPPEVSWTVQEAVTKKTRRG
ncbi:MAG: hypothetical protein V1784_05655 [bacterium]